MKYPSITIEGTTGLMSQYASNTLGSKIHDLEDRFVPSMERWLVECFHIAIGHSDKVHLNHLGTHFKVEVIDDFRDSEPICLASYIIPGQNQTNNDTSQFRVSALLICNTYIDIILDKGNAEYLIHVLIHEIMHLVDQRALKGFLAEQTKANQGTHAINHSPSTIPLGASSSWKLLDALNGIRAEGIAELGSYLLSPEAPEIDLQKSANAFRENIKSIFDGENDGSTNERSSLTLAQFVEINKYIAGPCFILDVMSASGFNKEATEIIDLWPNLRLGVKEQYAGILQKATKTDLGMCLKAIASPETEHPWGNLINPDDLCRMFFFLSSDKNTDNQMFEYENFLLKIFEHSRNGDGEAFQKLLLGVIGCNLPDDEIAGELARYWDSARNDDLSERFEILLEQVMAIDKANPSKLSRAILTYALDPQDVIPDNSPYSGLLDDCFVMEYGIPLIQKPI